MRRSHQVFLATTVMVIVASFFAMLSFSSEAVYAWLTNESRGTELLTAIAYLIAGGLLLRACWIMAQAGVNVRGLIMPGLLALLLIFIGGEEESWGQWLLGFSPPEPMARLNYQNETNIHNLMFFSGAVDSNSLAYGFILLYCVFLPLLSELSSTIRTKVQYLGVPILPLYLAPVFVIAFAYQEIAWAVGFPPSTQMWRHTELTEFFFSLGFLWFAYEYRADARQRSGVPKEEITGTG